MTAFALKSGSKGFADAAVSIPPDGRPFSVGDALKEGKGVITTDDPAEVEALRALDVLKEVSESEVAAIRKAAQSGGKGK